MGNCTQACCPNNKEQELKTCQNSLEGKENTKKEKNEQKAQIIEKKQTINQKQ